MKKERRFSLQTREGCKNYMILFMCLILLFSFIAGLIKTTGGKVKVENVKFDARGAVQDADLYMPEGTSSKSKLPCMILSHGGGCTKEVLTGFAQELARRGYVVLNCSSYGSGLSGQPMYDEDGSGVEKMAVTSQGLWDAVNYVRTLTFVDQTKIAIAGHSQGGYRCGYAALNDCSYLSVNDMLINFMYDEYGIEFTEEEILQDATELAQAKLNDDQMKFFEAKKAELTEWMDTRIKGVVSIGSNAIGIVDALNPSQEMVAGHEVTRYLQTNIALLCGEWDHNFRSLASEDYRVKYFQTGDKMYVNQWVSVDGNAPSATVLGSLDDLSITKDPALAEAIENRTTRLVIPCARITHSSEFLSKRAVTGMVKYTQQIFDYNNGPITGANNAIAPENIVWLNREYCNFLAMLCMYGFAISLMALLMKREEYAPILEKCPEDKKIQYNKIHALVFTLIMVGILIYCSYLCNNSMKKLSNPLVVLLPSNKFFPLDKTSCFSYTYLCWSGILLLLLMGINTFVNKKMYGKTGLETLGINIGFRRFLKTLGLALLVFICCYASMVVIRYLFGQDYRLWMCVFTDMQLIHWPQAIRYLIFLIPAFFVTSCAVNYIDFKENKFISSIIVAVLIGSAGVLINHFIHVIGLYTGSDASTFTIKLISEGSITGGLIIYVPLTIFIAKITHKLTGSVWMGTLLNSFLTAWMWVSAISSTNVYMGTTFAERFFGF